MMTTRDMSDFLKDFTRAVFALVVGLGLGCLLALLAGESPTLVLSAIIDGAFGSSYDRGMTLYYWTILVASGLSVAIPLQAGVFNIGSEGQITMGALCAALAGIYIPALHPFIAASVALVCACVGAFAWGAVAGYIRSYRGGHEVISSIMLNFIASAVSAWLVINHIQATDSQNPETPEIGLSYQLSKFSSFDHAPVTSSVFWMAGAVVLFAVLMRWSRARIRLKAVRQSPDAAEVAGYSVAKTRFWAFSLGAACCGLAGAAMVMSDAFRYRVDMSEGFGFLGIPVALLGKGRALGVVAAAFLMAFLHHGASNLDLESALVNRDLAQVMEAVVVACVVLLPALGVIKKWRKKEADR